MGFRQAWGNGRGRPFKGLGVHETEIRVVILYLLRTVCSSFYVSAIAVLSYYSCELKSTT